MFGVINTKMLPEDISKLLESFKEGTNNRRTLKLLNEELLKLVAVEKDEINAKKMAKTILNKHFNDILVPILQNGQSDSRDCKNVLKLLTTIVTISLSTFGKDILARLDIHNDVLKAMSKNQNRKDIFLNFFLSFLMESDNKIIELLVQKSVWFFQTIVTNFRNYDDFRINILLMKMKENFLQNRNISKSLKIQFFSRDFILQLLQIDKPQCLDTVSDFLEILCTTNKGVGFVFQNDVHNFYKKNTILKTILIRNRELFQQFWNNKLLSRFLLSVSLNCLDLTKDILLLCESNFKQFDDHFFEINRFLCNFFDQFKPFTIDNQVSVHKKALNFYKSNVIFHFMFHYYQSDQILSSSLQLKSHHNRLFASILKCLLNQLNIDNCEIREQFRSLAKITIFNVRLPNLNQLLQLWQISIEQCRVNEIAIIDDNFQYFSNILEIFEYYINLEIIDENFFQETDAKSFLLSIDFIPNLNEIQTVELFKQCVKMITKISKNHLFDNQNELLLFIFEKNNYDVNDEIVLNSDNFRKLHFDIWLKYFPKNELFSKTLISCMKKFPKIDFDSVKFTKKILRFQNNDNLSDFDNAIFELFFRNFHCSRFVENFNFNFKNLNLISHKFWQLFHNENDKLSFKKIKKFFIKNGPQFFRDVFNMKKIHFNHLELFSNFLIFCLITIDKIDLDFFNYCYQTVFLSTDISMIMVNNDFLKESFQKSLYSLINGFHNNDQFLLKYLLMIFEKNDTLSNLRIILFDLLSNWNFFEISNDNDTDNNNSLIVLMDIVTKIRLDSQQILQIFPKIKLSKNRHFELHFVSYLIQEEMYIFDDYEYLSDKVANLICDRKFAINLIRFWMKDLKNVQNSFEKQHLETILSTFRNNIGEDVVEFFCYLLKSNLISDDDCFEMIHLIDMHENLLFKLSLNSTSLQIKQFVLNKYRSAILDLKKFLISNKLAKLAICDALKVTSDAEFLQLYIATHKIEIEHLEIDKEVYLKWFRLNDHPNNEFSNTALINFMEFVSNCDDSDIEKIAIEQFNELLDRLIRNQIQFDNDFKRNILKCKICKSFFKCFRNGLDDFRSNSNNYLLMKLIKNVVVLLLHDDMKIDFFTKFSTSSQAILLNEHLSNEIKCDYLSMLSVIVEGIEKDVLQTSHLATFLSAYQATLSDLDQILLNLIRLFETHRIPGYESFMNPIIWSNIAQDYYTLLVNQSEDVLRRQPQMWHVMGLFDSRLVENTIDHFPKTRHLNFNQIQSPVLVYDPAFYLTCFSNLLEPEVAVNIHSFLKSGALYLTLIALSSYRKDIQKLAIIVLDKFYYHVDTFSLKNRHTLCWLHLIESVLRGLSRNQLKTHVTNNISAIFLAKTTLILNTPLHPLYKQLSYFMNVQKSFDLLSVPAFLSLFHGTDFVVSPETQEEARCFILNIIKQGTLNRYDVKALFRSMVFKMLFDFYTSSLCSQTCRILIIEIISKVVSVPLAAKVLISSFGIVNWVRFSLQYCNNIHDDCNDFLTMPNNLPLLMKNLEEKLEILSK